MNQKVMQRASLAEETVQTKTQRQEHLCLFGELGKSSRGSGTETNGQFGVKGGSLRSAGARLSQGFICHFRPAETDVSYCGYPSHLAEVETDAQRGQETHFEFHSHQRKSWNPDSSPKHCVITPQKPQGNSGRGWGILPHCEKNHFLPEARDMHEV